MTPAPRMTPNREDVNRMRRDEYAANNLDNINSLRRDEYAANNGRMDSR